MGTIERLKRSIFALDGSVVQKKNELTDMTLKLHSCNEEQCFCSCCEEPPVVNRDLEEKKLKMEIQEWEQIVKEEQRDLVETKKIAKIRQEKAEAEVRKWSIQVEQLREGIVQENQDMLLIDEMENKNKTINLLMDKVKAFEEREKHVHKFLASVNIPKKFAHEEDLEKTKDGYTRHIHETFVKTHSYTEPIL